MNSTEWLTVIVCAVVGYGVVNLLISKFTKPKGGGRPLEPFTFNDSNGPASPPHSSNSEAKRVFDDVDDVFDKRAQSAALSERPFGEEWFQILEVSPAATADEIRDAYKRQMSRYHPDKVASMGKEITDVAERKTKAIVWAYQVGLNSRERIW